MHLLTILLLLGILCQQFTEGLHVHPYKPSNCDDPHKKTRIKRSQPSSQINTNLESNHLSPLASLPGVTTSNSNQVNENPNNYEVVPPNHLQWDIGNRGVNTESEGNGMVGLAGLAHIHVFAAKAKARAAVARVRARARLHLPLLLESTPEEVLDDNVKMDHLQNNFQVTDPTLSSQHLRRKLDHQNNPALNPPIHQNFHTSKPSQQTAPSSVKPLQLDTNYEQHHHAPPSQLQTSSLEIANQPIISEGGKINHVAFPNFEVVVPTTLPSSARSAENYENNEYLPPVSAIPILNYNPQPEVRVYNIDNSEEVYQNRKPGFSIIPLNWKPPPDSNLYVQGEYQKTDGHEPILAVLPGKWTNNDGYDTYLYEDFDVVPVAYNIPEEAAQNYYGRSAESEEVDMDEIPEQFVGVKKQLQGWEKNPMIWRPNSNTSEQQRAASPSDKRHFLHDHSHTVIHKHIHNRGQPAISGHSLEFQSQSSAFAKPTGYVPIQHSGYAHAESQGQNSDFYEDQIPETFGHAPIQHSSFAHFQGQAEKSGFSHHLSHGHTITINNQKTMVVVPPDSHKNVEIAQVTGTNNGVSQSQSSSQAHQHGFAGNEFASHNSKFQSAQVSGHNNAVSQSQRTDEAPFVGRESEAVLGVPFVISFPSQTGSIWHADIDAPKKILRKRSIEATESQTDFKFSKKFFDILAQQNKLLKEIRESAKNDKELLFITEIGSNLLDNFEESLNAHSIAKRTVPFLRLIADPNAKLDVSKTLENVGTYAKNTFENKRAPMYHIKNVASSAKDAFLSTLRIVPQDFLVPSKYKIIDREKEGVEPSKLQYKISKRDNEEVGAITPSLLPGARSLRERIREKINPPKEVLVQQPEAPRKAEDPYNFSNTYQKIGSMLRDSVRSGQETLSHLGEIYHGARKAFATAQYSAPRVLLSGMRIPAVQRHPPLLPRNDKVLVIAPKIFQLTQEAVGAPHYSDNMNDLVGVGHVMDSLGISKPDAEQVGQRRIVFHPATVRRTSLLEKRPMVPNLQARSNFGKDVDQPIINNEKLRRYFVLSDTLEAEAPEESVQGTVDALNNAREAVGASSLRDFVLQMKDGISTFFKGKLVEARDKLSERVSTVPKTDLDYNKLKGKISQTLKFKVNNPLSPNAKLSQESYKNPIKFASEKPFVSENIPNGENQNEKVGAGLLLPKDLLKPFMGQPSKTERRQFFEDLGDSEELSEENKKEDQKDTQEVIGAINPILFNKTFQICDDRSPFEFLAALNGTKHNHTNSAFNNTPNKDDSSELWEHKCIYIRTTTKKTPEESSTKSGGVASTTKINIEDPTKAYGVDSTTQINIKDPIKADGVENTTKIKIEKGLDESDHVIQHTTIRSEEESITKNIESATEMDVNLKNQINTDDVRTSMKMGKALLTPFMGKPYMREIHTYYDQYDDTSEEDSYEDEYLGNPKYRNPEQLQTLPTDGSRKKDKGSSRKVAINQQNNLGDSLGQNFL